MSETPQRKTPDENEEDFENDEIPPDSGLKNQYIEEKEYEENQNDNNQKNISNKINKEEEVKDFNNDNQENNDNNPEKQENENITKDQQNKINNEEEENENNNEEKENIEPGEDQDNNEDENYEEIEVIEEEGKDEVNGEQANDEVNEEEVEVEEEEEGEGEGEGEEENEVNEQKNQNEIYIEENQNDDNINNEMNQHIENRYNINQNNNQNQMPNQIQEYQMDKNYQLYPETPSKQINPNIVNQVNFVEKIDQSNQNFSIPQQEQVIYQYSQSQNQAYQITELNKPYELNQNQAYQDYQSHQPVQIYHSPQSRNTKYQEYDPYASGYSFEIAQPEENHFRQASQTYELGQPTQQYQAGEYQLEQAKTKQSQEYQIYNNNYQVNQGKENIINQNNVENEEINWKNQQNQKNQEKQVNLSPQPQTESQSYSHSEHMIKNQVDNSPNSNQMLQFRKAIHQNKTTVEDSYRKKVSKNKEPRDSPSKAYISKYGNSLNSRCFDSSTKNKSSPSEKDNRLLVSFRNIVSRKKKAKSFIEKYKYSEYVEIPRDEYELNADNETIFLEGGMDSGSYRFKGKQELIKDNEIQGGKTRISVEEIMKEINRRTNHKKVARKKYEFTDKYFSLTDVDKMDSKNEKDKDNEKEKEPTNLKSNPKNEPDQPPLQTKSKPKDEEDKLNITPTQQPQLNSPQQSPDQSQLNPQQAPAKPPSSQLQFQQSQLQTQESPSQSQSPSPSQNIKIQPNEPNVQPDAEDKNHISNQDNNDNNESKEKKSFSPTDNYSKYLLEQINKIRVDPQSFIGVIEDSKANIIKHNDEFIYKDKISVALFEGEPAFDEAIEYLKNTESMGKLEYSPELTAQLPQNVKEIKDKNDLRKKVEKMLEKGYYIKSYWKDIIKDPEISFLLMIVDDKSSNGGMRRRDILNPKMKYIGISSTKINRNFVCYITLGYELKKNK